MSNFTFLMRYYLIYVNNYYTENSLQFSLPNINADKISVDGTLGILTSRNMAGI